MRKFGLLVIVSILCSPVYSKVLVYQLSESLTAISYSDANEFTGIIIQPKVNAIVVFDVDTTSYRVTNNGGQDANNPTAILCGKTKNRGMWFKAVGGATPDSMVTIYKPLENNSIAPFAVLKNGTATTSKATAIGIEIVDETTGFDTLTNMVGSNSSVDIGNEKISLPNRLCGQAVIFIDNAYLEGLGGSSTAHLLLNETRNANLLGLTVAQTVKKIQTQLGIKAVEVSAIPIP
jgi:hypothetical protein